MKTSGLMRILFGGMAIYLCLSSNVMASQHDMGEAMLTEELRALSTAVDNLTQQITQQAGAEQQDTTLRKLDIAIAYLNFRSRRIEMFEQDLQSTRANRNRLNDLLEQYQLEEKNLSQSFDSNQREALQKANEELGFRLQVVKDRVSRLDEEIILLENRIMDMQSQIDSVENFVEKNLTF